MIRINLNITIVDMVAQKKSHTTNNSTVFATAACLNEHSVISAASVTNKSISLVENRRTHVSLERALLQNLNVS